YPSSLAAESIVRRLSGRGKVLDVCAAPGGKSVYMAIKGLDVTSCDLYPHRVELINAYAKRMRVNLDARIADATELCPEYIDSFDAVLADVPCSGLGVLNRRKDVVINRTYDDIKALSVLQRKILDNVSRYVVKGGVLVYSTCTVFRMENDDVIEDFLSKHKDFSLSRIDLPYDNEGSIQFLPDGKGMEGFFICHLVRN
ncbi:MAG: SAM-dependent methyltransferase, partial [Christensenellales bacterium]